MALCNLRELRDLTGAGYQTIKGRLKGIDPAKRKGRAIYYDSVVALKAIYQEAGKTTDLATERARLAKVQADRQEIHLAMEREESAPIAVLGSALSRVAAIINARLQALPAKLKKRCPELSALALRSINHEIAELQNGIARIQLDRPDLPG